MNDRVFWGRLRNKIKIHISLTQCGFIFWTLCFVSFVVKCRVFCDSAKSDNAFFSDPHYRLNYLAGRATVFLFQRLGYCRFDNPIHQTMQPIPSKRANFYGLTLRRLMSYIYGAPILDVSRSHTTTQHSR